ncbi:MAG TPA: ATP-dependent Clp protease proteolytic subunit [Candidatus Acidoferrum sp.]|jgi:ATP-dependent Clp protease protease subunit|nr:ATP-dependent Clp protease proteolytic subunit [Candidatus Acidoferrum sp.]
MARFSTGLLVGAGQERCVPLRGRITRQVAACCIARLLVLATEQPGRPIIIYIDSPGGPVSESLPILSTMNGIKCPIATFCRGETNGTAAVIAARGTSGFRVANPGARLSFRRTAATRPGQDLVSDEKLFPALAEILAQNVRKPEAEVLAWLINGAEFSAAQAVANGLIDKVSPIPSLPPRA